MTEGKKAKAGLIGIVGEESKADFWGTMQRLADIGYQGIEGGGPALTQGDVSENLKRLNDTGIQLLTTSANREMLRDNLDKVVADAKQMRVPRVSCWWGPAESRDQILRDAELYEKAGARLAQEGIKLAYHNHGHEFKAAFNGVYAFDLLQEHTDPKHLHFVVDIAWVTFGGADPVQVLRRMGPRVASIHVKDILSAEDEKAQFTAVGTGIVNIKDSVRTAIDIGVEWAVVEQDRLRNLTAMETVTISYLYMKETGLV